MQESIIKGMVMTEAYGNNLVAGTVCVITNKQSYHVVTLLHLDQDGNWVVDGDYKGTVNSDKVFFKLITATRLDNYPIATKDWSRLIKRDMIGQQILFKLKPFKFKRGKSIQTCSTCYSHFMAAPTQPYCGECCQKASTAYAHDIPKSVPKKKSNLDKCIELFDKLTDGERIIVMDGYDKHDGSKLK